MTQLTKEEMRAMIREVVEETTKKAVEETFLRMGLQTDDPIEAQRDFQHLRSWRKSTESLGAKALAVAVGILITGALGALWAGLMTKLHP